MPIYEYRCASCGAEMEKLQKISDPPLLECPECGKDTLVKLISASSFRLKGSGWYETDFKTGKKKNGAADTAESGAAESGTADKSAAEKNATEKSTPETPRDSATESKISGKESKKEATKSNDSSGTGTTKKKPTPQA